VELIYAFPSADSFVGQGRPGGGTLLSELDILDFTPAMRLWTASELRRFGNAAGRFWHRSVVGVTQLADALPIGAWQSVSKLCKAGYEAAASSAGVPMMLRNLSSSRASNRETCIWLMPSSWAISDCERCSK
jgi:hypothetical protein